MNLRAFLDFFSMPARRKNNNIIHIKLQASNWEVIQCLGRDIEVDGKTVDW